MKPARAAPAPVSSVPEHLREGPEEKQHPRKGPFKQLLLQIVAGRWGWEQTWKVGRCPARLPCRGTSHLNPTGPSPSAANRLPRPAAAIGQSTWLPARWDHVRCVFISVRLDSSQCDSTEEKRMPLSVQWGPVGSSGGMVAPRTAGARAGCAPAWERPPEEQGGEVREQVCGRFVGPNPTEG